MGFSDGREWTETIGRFDVTVSRHPLRFRSAQPIPAEPPVSYVADSLGLRQGARGHIIAKIGHITRLYVVPFLGRAKRAETWAT
mgnify:CR=1 FL=1